MDNGGLICREDNVNFRYNVLRFSLYAVPGLISGLIGGEPYMGDAILGAVIVGLPSHVLTYNLRHLLSGLHNPCFCRTRGGYMTALIKHGEEKENEINKFAEENINSMN